MPAPPKRYEHEDLNGPEQPPLQYNHWQPLHEEENPSPERLEIWEAGIRCDYCKVKYRAMKEANPPRFGDWFRWSWEIHNTVNTHLGRDEQSFDDAIACWRGIAPHRSPRLVLTIAVGRRFAELLKLTRPLMEAYAKRCNADFIALTNQRFDQWQREKFRVHDFAKQYSQTLFVDADAIIRESCPDLFELYPDADVVMHDDYKHHTPPIDPAWAEPDHDFCMRAQDVSPKWSGRMWNSGIVLTSQRAASIWTPPAKRLPNTGVSEQWWVQYQAERDFQVTELPGELNWQWWFPSFASGTVSAEIVHISGTREKLDIVKQFVSR